MEQRGNLGGGASLARLGPKGSKWLRRKLSGLGPAPTTPNSCQSLLKGKTSLSSDNMSSIIKKKRSYFIYLLICIS